MAKQIFINNFQSQFTAPVKSAPTTGDPDNELDYGILRISSGAAVYLAPLNDGNWYTITGFKKSGSVESNIEIIKVLAVDSSVVNELRIYVQRGQEGTQAQSYMPGDYLGMRVTAHGLTNFVQAAAMQSGLDTKVDKVTGKGLSTQDYATADRDKLAGIAVGATANASDAQLRDRTTHTGTQSIATVAGLQAALDSKVEKVAGKGLSTNDYSTAEATKLGAIAEQATKNATDAQLRDRSTHTGTQAVASIDNLQSTLDAKVDAQEGKGLSSNDFTAAEKAKLAGISGGATANSSDAQLLNRANHTGITPLNGGGTGSNTAAGARSNLGLGSAALAALVGVVSQLAGVPNGAVMQRGVNGNGEFIRLADGTQICWRVSGTTGIAVAAGSVFVNGASFGPYSWPAEFISQPTEWLFGAKVDGAEGHSWACETANPTPTQSGKMQLFRVTSDTANYFVRILAIGRWY
ncbi:hypothetical protein [Comamonas koreensis]|uniref:hypothetical protein n=1 Tax=Comamonas koreensis TaxID=160825 RepID=UPI0015FC5D9C|nr:hypothetical protein [Comamonas koreensis]